MSEAQQLPALFGFDRALQLLKAGQSVRRASWRADMRISLPTERAIMQSAPPRAATPWRWTLDHASILATDWQLASPLQNEAAP